MRKKKKDEDKEPVTQSLPLRAEPPLAIAAETARLTFQVSPLSAKGLLSQQSKDALKALMQANRGGAIVRLRAFVAGTGDMRRVQQILSETFSDKKIPLPVLTTVQVGSLPMVGAQVIMEAISVDKKVVNPEGLVYFPGVAASDIQSAVEHLKASREASGVKPSGILAVSCFTTSLDDGEAVRASLHAAFPDAALNVMQTQRVPQERSAACEATGRLEPGKTPQSGLDAVILTSPKLVFSGIQMAFGQQDADLRLAFERLKKGLASVPNAGNIVVARFYTMDTSIARKLPVLGRELFPHDRLATTPIAIEGLPSLDASMGMDVIAESPL